MIQCKGENWMQYESFIDVDNYCLGATLGQVKKGWVVSLWLKATWDQEGKDK